MALKTQVIKINPEIIQHPEIEAIVDVLRRGGVIAFPTDTFYGLGSDCFSPTAVKRIYNLKKRKEKKPLPVLISDLRDIAQITSGTPPFFNMLSKKLWPGPLTLVLKASSLVPKDLLGPSGTVGVRIPNVLWIREMVKMAGFPVTATSANISGNKEIEEAAEVMEVFSGKVDLIVDGGKTMGKKPSTVLDLTSGKPRVLRQGAISEEELRKYIRL